MTDGDRLGRTAVHYAAADGDADGLRVLSTGGLAAGAADDAGWTPLHVAAQAQAPSAVEDLLAVGVAVDAADRHGNPPLWKAVFCSPGEGASQRRPAAESSLHTITLIRMRLNPATKAYIARRVAEGKTSRDAQRCLKQAVCRGGRNG
ncbi:ankyrin repeat domain-containing protein [Streptomyces cinerochromogenes]|uniref:Ankyrin repeat domain-containing protein n=1 Tax=Streptomyces cinerochromogenes TaxID=66422 RepID=A0ABW7BD14_9ACTN